MNLSTVEIPRAGARQRAAEYMRAARSISDPDRAREFEEIARAYRAAAAGDVALISLSATIRAGGTMPRTLIENGRWIREEGRHERVRREYLLPHLAVCRWDAAYCYTLGVEQSGGVRFIDSIGRTWRYRAGMIDVAAGFDLGGYTAARPVAGDTRAAWTAMVPLVPPQHRPTRGMGNRLVLWEVDKWDWQTVPAPPGDPALLRAIGGDLYAVEAVWDLTPLEQAVLSGRRPDAS